MFALNGFNALVTGASGGIGRAIAVALAKQGAGVVLSGTRPEALSETANEIKQLTGIDASIITCNLSDPQSVEELFPQAEALVEKIDILVNNAGITRDGLAMRMKDDDWQTVIDVNLTASFRLCRSAIKAMMRRRHGRIINIASIVGISGNAGQVNYCAAKAGVVGMSKSLAIECASRGITVNCIAPGFIQTPMTHDLPDAVREKMLGNIPAGAYGKPEDIASAAVYLASAEAAYVTGQTLHVNGGMLMV
jgi:3-oxoacyl-[acyl-carrier protein] reductase